MAPGSTEKLDAILERIDQHRDDFREFRTEVLGSATDEKSTGRLPRLEAGHAHHEKRIARLERIVYAALGAFGLVKLLAESGDSIARLFGVFRGHN